jgi:hypothetical protein
MFSSGRADAEPGMSIIDTALIYIGIPILIVAVLAFGVFGRTALHQPNRYRPGRPWAFEPVWFVPHPAALNHTVPTRKAIGGQAAPAELEGAIDPVPAVGGASGEW